MIKPIFVEQLINDVLIQLIQEIYIYTNKRALVMQFSSHGISLLSNYLYKLLIDLL